MTNRQKKQKQKKQSYLLMKYINSLGVYDNYKTLKSSTFKKETFSMRHDCELVRGDAS